MRTSVRLAILVLLVGLLSPVTPVRADSFFAAAVEQPWYVGLEAGLGVYNGFNPVLPGYFGDTGFQVGAATALRLGRQWNDHLRMENELAWNGSAIGSISGRVDVLAWTQNVYYDFGERDAFIRPYVGAGIGLGFGWLESNLPSAAPTFTDRSGVGFAYVIEGGGRFRLTDRLSATAAWHFLGTAGLISDGLGGSISPTMHAFMLGLQQKF